MNLDYFENEYVEYKIENGIIFQIFKPNLTKIEIRLAKQIVQDRFRITNGRRMPMFVDTNKGVTMDKESRDYFAGEESLSDLKAVALLIHNPMAFLASQLFLIMNKPKVKFEFFNDRKKALLWLEKFK